MRGRSIRRSTGVALVLGLAGVAGPMQAPAQAACAELTLYLTWHGADPTGQSTTPVHNGCVTETGQDQGVAVTKDHAGTWTPPGTPSGYYLHVSVPYF